MVIDVRTNVAALLAEFIIINGRAFDARIKTITTSWEYKSGSCYDHMVKAGLEPTSYLSGGKSNFWRGKCQLGNWLAIDFPAKEGDDEFFFCYEKVQTRASRGQ